MKRTVLSRWIGVLLVFLLGETASAQISEADRLARCQNNREALALLEFQQQSAWSDEQIARAYTAISAIQRLDDALVAAQNRLNELTRQRGFMECCVGRSPATQQTIDNLGQQIAATTREIEGLQQQIRAAGTPFGLFCLDGDLVCYGGMRRAVETARESAIARRGERDQMARQAETYRSNIRALNCDGAVTYAGDALGSRWSEEESGWTGDWVRRGSSNQFDATWTGFGTVRALLTISISGNNVHVSRQDVGATAGVTCQYQGTLSGRSVSGTYSCNVHDVRPWSATIR